MHTVQSNEPTDDALAVELANLTELDELDSQLELLRAVDADGELWPTIERLMVRHCELCVAVYGYEATSDVIERNRAAARDFDAGNRDAGYESV